MSRRWCAGCFYRRRGGASKMAAAAIGGVSETDNTRFSTKFKVTQSLRQRSDSLSAIFPRIPLFLLLMLNL